MTGGYMQTKANQTVVPDGWIIGQVGRLCSIRNDLRKPISVEERKKISGCYPYYGPTGVLGYINEFLLDGEYALIGEDGDHFLKPREKRQSIFVSGRFNVNNHAHVIESTEKCCAKWFSLYFEHKDITDYLSRQGANRFKLNKATLEKIPIILPPLPEQKAIAETLSTWDVAIEKLETLIASKLAFFDATLDQLVFRKRDNTWKLVRLGDAFQERIEIGREDLPLLSISRDAGVTSREDSNRKDNSSEDKSKYLCICPGDIGYNTMRMWQGVSAFSRIEGIVSPAYTVCIPNDDLINGEFAALLFKHPWVIHQFYRYSQGLTSDTWNLKFHHFSQIRVWIPSLVVQRQIVVQLELIKRELAVLKKQNEALKLQKRGLMQKLLTGTWRVVVREGM